ncbi:hypothetical protein Q7O_000380 [Pectobacterium carotovorum subsp. carotovorum PCCS1]|nr:hypothetical protein [Pectobacterium carotovorum subsp. carotovorum PCCS1]
MSAKSVLKKLGIDAEINHTTISEASAFRYDVILTQKIFADILTSDANEDEKKRIIILNKLTDKDEIEEKILAYIQAHK